MKILKKTALFILIATILFLTVTCVEPSPDDKNKEITYLGDKLNVSNEQVWMPNYNTGKVSQMLLKFEGNRTVDVVVELVEYNSGSPPSILIDSVGSGKIEKGILSFKVDAMDDSKLLGSNELLLHCFEEWYLDKDSKKNIVMTPEVKGNIITLVTLYNDDSCTIPTEGVIREGFSGTSDSLTGEYIYYIYIKDKCKITAEEVKKTDLKYTFKKIELSLEAGWNTILKSETYTTTGDSSYSMTIKNPAINWVMQKIR